MFEVKEHLNPEDYTTRYRGANWYDLASTSSVTILGLGGIGSNLSYGLSRTNPTLMRIVDGDRVDESNLGGQMFHIEDVDDYKVYGVRRIIGRYSPSTRVEYLVARITQDNINQSIFNGKIVFTGFDNMEARKLAYSMWKEKHAGDPEALFIDGRCSIDTVVVYTIEGDNPDKMARYEEEFFSDEEAESTLCSLKQTTYVASMTGNIMVNNYINWLDCRSGGFSIVPFKNEFNTALCRLETIV